MAEIFDHCILYGDSPTDLNIQSFFNFECQKFTKLKLITTMCDTLACFLGLNNENPLSKHSLVEGKFFFKVEKVLKGSLDLIPLPLPSVKIQIMGGKICLRSEDKTLLGIVNKFLKTKSLLTSPSNVLPYYLK